MYNMINNVNSIFLNSYMFIQKLMWLWETYIFTMNFKNMKHEWKAIAV